MEVKFLWIQESLKRKRFVIRKIAGVDNCADVLTKPQSFAQNKNLLNIMNANVLHREAANDQQVDHVEARRFRLEPVARVRWADDIIDDMASDDLCEINKVLGYTWTDPDFNRVHFKLV